MLKHGLESAVLVDIGVRLAVIRWDSCFHVQAEHAAATGHTCARVGAMNGLRNAIARAVAKRVQASNSALIKVFHGNAARGHGDWICGESS